MESYGFLSILPPLVAVALAWRFKNVLASLLAGCFTGTLILFRGNPMTAVVDLIRNTIFVQAADAYNSNLLVMMVFIGGFVGVVTDVLPTLVSPAGIAGLTLTNAVAAGVISADAAAGPTV